MKYILFDKTIIAIDDDNIVREITNVTNTKTYKRVGNRQRTYICGKQIPSSFSGHYYNSREMLEKANGLYDYSKDICGVYTTYYITGKLKEEYFHINNIKNGIYKLYFETGDIEIECEYIDNKLNGYYKKYDNKNNLLIECFYKDDKLDGIYKKYSPNYYNDTTIIPRYCEKYVNGDKILYTNTMYVDGIVSGDYICKYNKYICTSTTLNNIILDIKLKNINTNIIIYDCKKYDCTEIENDTFNYKNQVFYESGELMLISYMENIQNADGEYTEYYKNGKIKEIKRIKCNKVQYIESYYENGNIKETKDSIKDSIKDEESENKIYIHKTFYENGNLKEESKYDCDNRLLFTISYYENTKIKSKRTYKHNFGTTPFCTETYNEDGILTHYKDYDDFTMDYNGYIKNKNILENKEKLKKFAQMILDSLN